MSLDPQSRLLQPYQLGPVQLRNRVVLPAHTTNFGANNLPTVRNMKYLAARAEGGVGLIITEAIRVHPSSAGRHLSLGSFDDESIPAYEMLTEGVHTGGAKIFAQIMHLGRQAAGDATRTAAWGASALPWARGAVAPHVMGSREIHTLVKAFGAAARRMRQAGFDGLEIHAGHGHLIEQFLSPATNQRTDKYGGTLTNRIRLCREVLEEVFSAADGLAVGLRVSVDEFIPGGMVPHDVLEVLDVLTQEFDLAYVHASHSAYQSGYALSTQMADMHFPQTPFIEHARIIKEAFPQIPVIAVCRVDTLNRAAEIIEDGVADLVALARPHIADPQLVNKALSGASNTVVSCLACNQGCIGRVELNLPISCVVNPEVGEEGAWQKIRSLPRQGDHLKVLVVGGGPAGMKAALSAHNSGAQVVLAEASHRLGGQVVMAAAVGGRDRLILATDELARDIAEAGIEVRLNHPITADAIIKEDFDHIVVATGSIPVKRSWPTSVPIVDAIEAINLISSNNLPQSGRVIILDEEGTWSAASVAEHLARSGLRTEIISPTATLFGRITTYTKANLLDRLASLPIGVRLMQDIAGFDGDTALLHNTVTGDTSTLDDVCLVVDVAPPRANDQLYADLQEISIGLDIIGDANSPRSVLEAIYEGHRIGSAITKEKKEIDKALTLAV